MRNSMKPEEIFTPRAAEINEDMYVARPDLEDSLKSGLRTGFHIIVHGESGSGKTWLYKKVFREKKFTVVIANLANAARLGSINKEFENLVDRECKAEKIGYSESKGIGTPIKLSHTGDYKIGDMEPFESILNFIAKKVKRGMGVLVLDNLEAIRDRHNMMEELANIITLLDDERYASYGIKILLVGVPGDLKEYFLSTPNLSTIANRLRETPEVSRMTHEQCSELVLRGFKDKLHYKVFDDTILKNHCTWVTDRLPQRVHEYCLELAFICEKKQSIEKEDLELANSKWLASSLSANYALVESMMNERDTKVGRRNQTLFSLGTYDKAEFRWSDIEEEVRKNFPVSTQGKLINVAQILSGLSSHANPLIRRSPKGDMYIFSDPKCRMCLRLMLKKNPDDESVVKIILGNTNND